MYLQCILQHACPLLCKVSGGLSLPFLGNTVVTQYETKEQQKNSTFMSSKNIAEKTDKTRKKSWVPEVNVSGLSDIILCVQSFFFNNSLVKFFFHFLLF